MKLLNFLDQLDCPYDHYLFNVIFVELGSQEMYLPFMLRGKLKLMLEGDETQQDLLDFVVKALRVHDRKALLEVKIVLFSPGLVNYVYVFCICASL